MKIDPDALAKTIEETLREYADVTENAAFDGALHVADKCVNELQSANPPGAGKYGSWNAYNKSWDRSIQVKKGKSSVVVHNKKYYRLVHLLENGHALRNGGKSKAFPHVAPVAEKAEAQLLDEIKKMINQ